MAKSNPTSVAQPLLLAFALVAAGLQPSSATTYTASSPADDGGLGPNQPNNICFNSLQIQR